MPDEHLDLFTHLLCVFFHLVGPNGAHFSGSVETEYLRAPPKKDLRLASLTRSLYIDAPEGMTFRSAGGDVGITSFKDVTIKSIDGMVRYTLKPW